LGRRPNREEKRDVVPERVSPEPRREGDDETAEAQAGKSLHRHQFFLIGAQ